MRRREATKINEHCPNCNKETSHYQLLLQKPSEYGDTPKEKVKAFADGYFSALGGTPVLAALDLLDRHLICRECGVRRIQNEGEEFQ